MGNQYGFSLCQFFAEGSIMSKVRVLRFAVCVFFLVCFFCGLAFGAPRKGWKRKDVDIRAGNGRRIRGIYYPEGKEVLLRKEKKSRARSATKPSAQPMAKSTATEGTSGVVSSVSINTIDSPPIDGFIPWIAVTATDEHVDIDEMDFYAAKQLSIIGEPLPDIQASDFAIGIFDTGASAHVMGYGASQVLNVEGSYLTNNLIEISGVTGSVFAWVSEPLALFIAGLSAIDPVEKTLDTSVMVGESNISIVVGDEPLPDDPDLPTAIGAPMSVFFTTVINNENEITIEYGGEEYTAPDISVFDHDDANVPDYPIAVPLELRPLGAFSVGYIAFDLEDILNGNIGVSSPSVIIGNFAQSLFFVHAVDMDDDGNSAFDKDRFMFDTGAQVTVIGSRIAARLGIDPDSPEFIVDIEGVTGDVSWVNGYYIDSVEIPALGEWLRFTNVPVILLDIASPEGGTLDGIIGMNLFTEYNMVLRGGGMFLEDDPMLELERIVFERNVADIWPAEGDGKVNLRDFAVCADEWLSGAGAGCDIAPIGDVDGEVDILDLAVLAENWLDGAF
ncbi:MAG: hypothetical protein FVQ79_11205 [Planctomycetes bacterium]|nr:hypothetical protein [Planctomycetota bacterium]